VAGSDPLWTRFLRAKSIGVAPGRKKTFTFVFSTFLLREFCTEIWSNSAQQFLQTVTEMDRPRFSKTAERQFPSGTPQG
jgi:hypothetical protein